MCINLSRADRLRCNGTRVIIRSCKTRVIKRSCKTRVIERMLEPDDEKDQLGW